MSCFPEFSEFADDDFLLIFPGSVKIRIYDGSRNEKMSFSLLQLIYTPV